MMSGEPIRIGLIGDYDPTVLAHQAIPQALALASQDLGRSVEYAWIGTETLTPDAPRELTRYHGIWCVPASPYRSMNGALRGIRFARETGRGFLGTCGGFQHALIEYARHVLGIPDADHLESTPGAAVPFIAPLSCALVERSGVIRFVEGSRMRAMYRATEAEEEYHCCYGLNPRYAGLLDERPLRVSGRDLAGDARAVELEGHPFFFATLYQPERAALRGRSHPLVTAFVAACAS